MSILTKTEFILEKASIVLAVQSPTRRYLNRWTGKLAVRSGTARMAMVPAWDDDVPLADQLPLFPGTQVLMIVPAHAETA